MIRIWHPYRRKMLERFDFRSRFCVLFLLIVHSFFYSKFAWPNDRAISKCVEDGFGNISYFLDTDSIGSVSAFFTRIPEMYFELGDASFSIYRGVKSRNETYFDNAVNDLLNYKFELLIVVEENLPTYRAARERVIFRSLSTGEVDVFETKRYNKTKSALDKHQLFGQIKRKQRQRLVDKLNLLSIDRVEKVEAKLQVQHKEVVLLISHFGVSYGAIILDQIHISNFGIPNTNTLLRLEVFSDKLKKLKADELTFILESFCKTNTGIRESFSSLTPQPHFGYPDYDQLAQDILSSRQFFMSHPGIYKLGQIVALMLIGIMLLRLFIGRYKRHLGYRVTTKTSETDSKHDQE